MLKIVSDNIPTNYPFKWNSFEELIRKELWPTIGDAIDVYNGCNIVVNGVFCVLVDKEKFINCINNYDETLNSINKILTEGDDIEEVASLLGWSIAGATNKKQIAYIHEDGSVSVNSIYGPFADNSHLEVLEKHFSMDSVSVANMLRSMESDIQWKIKKINDLKEECLLLSHINLNLQDRLKYYKELEEKVKEHNKKWYTFKIK